MSIINNGLLLASGADAAVGYQISRSIRLNSADSAYFSRTPGSAGSRTTWTWSGWVKRSALSAGGVQVLFGIRNGLSDTATFYVGFNSGDTLIATSNLGGVAIESTAVYRDLSAWMHVVAVADTSNATASDRLRLYVNGSRITALNQTLYPSSGANLGINQAHPHTVGAYLTSDTSSPSFFFSGYLADIYFLDGTATTPSTFAETDAITGQWVPKTPTGISYGTNGFRLTFSDNSGTTSTTLGKDAAGSNNWSPNNFSVASGSGNDSLVDSPTSYGTDTGAGAEVRGNYCTLNPLNAAHTYSNGNLDLTISTASHASIPPAVGSIGMGSGKWYFEFTPTSITSNPLIGITAVPSTDRYPGYSASSYGYYASDGWKYNNASSSSYGSTWAANDVIGVAFDSDAGKLWFSKNGTWQASGNPASGTNAAFTSIPAGTYFPSAHKDTTGSGTFSGVFNFGQRAFAYTAPSGFRALCDTNLTTPTIAKPANYFNAITYVGSSTPQTISGLNFTSDLIWIKSRSHNAWHILQDSIRGFGKTLFSNSTNQEVGNTNDLISSVSSTGFSVNTNYNGGTDTATTTNGGSYSYAAWAWLAAGSNTTDTTGSITSTRRTNATSGCSVVTYTGNGFNSTIGHGLGAAPSLIIVKKRSATGNWHVYHSGISNMTSGYIMLNSTGGFSTATNTLWNGTSPTSTVFTVGTDTDVNTSGGTHVAYCFAPVAGYSAFGSYTGNGSTDGPFVFTGHRSRFILLKRTDTTSDWYIFDTARNTYNALTSGLFPNASDAEATNSLYAQDVVANGWKIRSSQTQFNASGGTYVYASFAEFPFAYARAR